MKKHKDFSEQDIKDCDCGCDCGSDCHCDDNCDCGCGCGEECNCDSECECGCKSGGECGCGGSREEDCDCTCDKETEADHYEVLADEYLTLARQVQADFDNYRKRNVDAVNKAREDGKASVIVKILPCADVIDKAISMTTDASTLEGLKMVANKFQDVLAGLGVTKYESKGQMFDVNLHNAITAVESDKPSGTVVDEYECGYRMGDKVIRFAQVIISK